MLGALGDGGEDGEELVAFVLESGKAVGWNDFGIDEEFEPVGGFIEFLEADADLCDKLNSRTRTVSFAVIGPDRGS